MKRLKKSQQLLVRTGNVSVYSTAGAIRSGIGQEYRFNAAVQKALDSLEFMMYNEKHRVSGLSGTWEGMNIQVDIV